MSKEQLEATQKKMTALEAEVWSLFYNNALFTLSFLFLAFYVLRSAYAP
jgi:hypothetical protein